MDIRKARTPGISLRGLESPRVVITGATSGIGRALALLLCREDCKLILVGRNDKKLQEITQKCVDEGARNIVPVLCDLSKPEQIIRIADAVQECKDGEIILVNNAGVNPKGPFTDCSLDDLMYCVQTNFVGPLLLSRYLVPMMEKEGEGQIINVASILAEDILPNFAIYSATKSGLNHFSESLARDLADKGIRVVSVMPGPVDTAFWEGLRKPSAEHMLPPESVAELIIEVMTMPQDRCVETVKLMPLKGIPETQKEYSHSSTRR